MRGVSKPLLALAAIALLVLALSACGGGDSSADSTASTTSPEATATSPADGGGEAGVPSDRTQGEGEDQGSGATAGSKSSGDSSADEGSAAFRTPGGDNSIQDYGEEPDEGEFEAANTVLTDFMEARAKGDWSGMCAELAEAAVAPLEDLASRAPQFKGSGCAAILKTLLGSSPAASRANTLTTDIASFRVEGERGFALYHGSEGADYFVPMMKEDGEWKVGALAPSEFP